MAAAGIPQAHLRQPDQLYKGCSVATTEPGVEKLLIIADALGLAHPQPPPHTLRAARLRPRPLGTCQATERQEGMP